MTGSPALREPVMAAQEAERLTPRLAQVAAAVYMMIADGQISEGESGKLQAMVGDDDRLLQRALDYVGQVPAGQFISDAAAILDDSARQAVLLNACDAAMDDGRMNAAGQALLENISTGFGQTNEKLRAAMQVMSAKSRLSVLGRAGEAIGAERPTARVALIVAALYLFASDRAAGGKKIGRLVSQFSDSADLLKAALRFAAQGQVQTFLADASGNPPGR